LDVPCQEAEATRLLGLRRAQRSGLDQGFARFADNERFSLGGFVDELGQVGGFASRMVTVCMAVSV
jgi:hypothetical protein